MVNKSIELFVIVDVSRDVSLEDEYFNTFEEARSHISDRDNNGRYKYTGFWTDKQSCKIKRLYIEPGMKCMRETNSWSYYDNELCLGSCYITDEEHEYKGEVW